METLTRRQILAGAGLLIAASACSAPANGSRAASRDGTGHAPAPPVRPDLYACEGCEAALERPAAGLPARVRIGPPGERGEPMRIDGIVYQSDGVTPAADIVVYAHHTDATGLYSRGTPETEWSRRHGLLRAWVKTGPDGRYGYDTIKPAPYPDNTLPAHVHLMMLEPGRTPYYVDDIVFEDDPLVNAAYRATLTNRGGDGIVRLTRDGGVWLARRDIVLERHPA